MIYEYYTLDAARVAVKAAIRDARADNPSTTECDIEHDMILVVADMCEPSVRAELLRIELGWYSHEIQDHCWG